MIRQVLWLVILEHLWTVMWNYVGQRALLWHLKSYFVQFLTYKCFIHKWHFHAIIYYHLRSLILLSLYLFSRAPDATGSWTIKKKMKWIYRKYLCVCVWWWWGGDGDCDKEEQLTGQEEGRNTFPNRSCLTSWWPSAPKYRSPNGLSFSHKFVMLPENTLYGNVFRLISIFFLCISRRVGVWVLVERVGHYVRPNRYQWYDRILS